jgi:hypothetical protein
MPRNRYLPANACRRIEPMRPVEPVMTTVFCSANVGLLPEFSVLMPTTGW